MEKQLEQLKEFHVRFKQHISSSPSKLPREVAKLRLKIMLEELTEVARSFGHESYGDYQRILFDESQKVHKDAEASRESLQPDIVETLDGFADLLYVVYGSILACGLNNQIEKGFDEVHRSNMTKASFNAESAEATRVLHTLKLKGEGKGDTCYLEKQPDDSYLCFRSSDKKLLKSVTYSPANLKQFLENV